jgi:putative sterol carrier protein
VSRDISWAALTDLDIRLTMASDDLIAMTDGRLHFGKAWASGKVKLEAGLRDILRLRKVL